jgi:hypothetical protein
MCGNDEDSVLFTAARVRGQKIVAIERLKEATAIALRKPPNRRADPILNHIRQLASSSRL